MPMTTGSCMRQQRLYRHDDQVGLHHVGHSSVLSAVLRLQRLPGTSRPTALPPRPTHRLGPTGAARRLWSLQWRRRRRPLQPGTGTYARGAAAYGPYGARGVARPTTGARDIHSDATGVKRLWKLRIDRRQRGNDWAKTNRSPNGRTGTTTRTINPMKLRRHEAREGATVASAIAATSTRKRRQRLSTADRDLAEARDGGSSDTDRRPSIETTPTPNDPIDDGEQPAPSIAARRISSIAMQPLAERVANGPGLRELPGQQRRPHAAALAAAAVARGAAGAGSGAEQNLARLYNAALTRGRS